MTVPDWLRSRRAAMVKALSLLLAALLWLSVIVERPAKDTLLVEVEPEHMPPGLALCQPPSGVVEVTVSGPRILIWLLPIRDVRCRVDLSGARAGVVYSLKDDSIDLPDADLKVVRISPQIVQLYRK